jgi:hypothetical protein
MPAAVHLLLAAGCAAAAAVPVGAAPRDSQPAMADDDMAAAASATTIAKISTVMADGKHSVAESVFDWRTEHCADGRPLGSSGKPYRRDVPDAPAMAWRDPASNLTYVAPGDSRGTWPSIGPSLDEVKHDCGTMIFNYSGQTGFLQPASDFSSHEWLYAPYVVPGAGGENATLYMLAHNEFHGWEHPGLCNATRMVQGRCWYNAVGLSVSHDGGRNIRHIAPPPHHLVAASPDVYVPDHGAYGVFSPSQIVSFKGWLYSFPRCRSKDGGSSGVCIMRIQEGDLHDPSAWRFWRGGGEDSFTGRFADPYSSDHSAAAEPAILAFGAANDTASPSQPVPRWLPQQQLLVMVGFANMPTGHGPGGHFGWSVAKAPWGPWTKMLPIEDVDVNPTKDVGAIRGLYPSLLDPNSPSLNYDTIVGDTAYVYWVQGRNKTAVAPCPDMARDLWRQKVRISFEEQTAEKTEKTDKSTVAAGSSAKKECVYHNNTDYWGGDLLHSGVEFRNVTAVDYKHCGALCIATEACRSFTYDANSQWPCGNKCCWLKGLVNASMTHEHEGAWSGLCGPKK